MPRVKSNKRNSQLSQAEAAPLARTERFRVTEPQIRQGNRSTRIKHTELIDTVPGTIGFGATSYSLNPGLSHFQWLSSQAGGWEQYRFHSLRVHYITRAPTDREGSVMLCPDYDPLDSAPESEIQAMSYLDSKEGPVWQSFFIQLKPSDMFPMGPRKYIRDGIVPGDLKTYDAGVVHVCTVAQTSTANIGKLLFEYDVELFIPQTDTSVPVPRCITQWQKNVNQSLTSSVRETVDFDTLTLPNLGIQESAGIYTLPDGIWLITWEVNMYIDPIDNASMLIEHWVDGTATTPATASELSDIQKAGNLQASMTALVIADNGTTVQCEVTGICPPTSSILVAQFFTRATFQLVS